MSTVDATTLRRYAADPLAFIGDLRLPVSGLPRFGDVWAPFQVVALQALAPSLVAVSRGDKPTITRYWWERTKGASKDSDIAAGLLWLLSFTRRPVLVQVGADDQAQAAEVRRAVQSIVWANEWLAARVEAQVWRVVCDGTGSVCEFITSDASSSHGSRPDVLIVNELSHVGSRDFAETLLDNLTKMANGLGIIATNAGFNDSWQWEWREIARTSERWHFHKVEEPAPWLDSAAVEEAQRRNPPSRYRRLYLGVWANEGEGDALDDSWLTRAVCLPGPPNPCKVYPDPEGWIYGAGVDAGLRKDSTGVVVLRARSGGKVELCETWVRKPRKGETILIAEIVGKVLELHRKWRLSCVVFDPWQLIGAGQEWAGKIPMVREIPATAASQRLQANALLEGFREGIVQLYDEPALLRDLRSASIEETGNLGGLRINWPRSAAGHCDLGAAFALLLPLAIATTKAPIFDPEAEQDRLVPGGLWI